MEHEQANLLLSDYLDDSLESPDRRGLEEHLATCDQCRHDLDLLQNALRLVHNLPRPKAPAHFVGSVRRRARKAGLSYGRRVRRSAQRLLYPFQSSMTLAVLLAAAGAVIVMALLLHSQVQLTIQQPPPIVIPVTDVAQLNMVARSTWKSQGRVLITGREVPQGSPLGAAIEVDLVVPANRWPAFVNLLREAGLATDLPEDFPDKQASDPVSALVRVQPKSRSPKG